MNIFVLMKRTFDTEEKIAISGGKVSEDGVEFIINPYDEYAIEEALRVREAHGGEITVISVDDEEAEKQLRTALAMGVDKAVLINIDVAAGSGFSDQYTTAKVLAEYLTNKRVDLILAGNVAIDGASGQVGPRVAEMLGIPYVTAITKLVISGKDAIVTRDVEGDSEIIATTLPLLVTAQQGLNEPRYPSLPGIMKAKRKPLAKLTLADLGFKKDDVAPKTKIIELSLPSKKEDGKILSGELDSQVKELVHLLHTEAKVV